MTMDTANDTPFTREELLIGRVASNEADDAEWRDFESVAASDVGAWERLARSLRDELQMRAALDRALAPADDVAAPAEASPIAGMISARRAGSWSGWAVAAAVAIVWVGVGIFAPGGAGGGDPTPLTAGINASNFASPEDALTAYKQIGAQHGRVLDELPLVMIETRPIGDSGRFEVLYVRQLLERAPVDSTWRLDRDDTGRRAPVPVDLASYRRSESDL